MKKLLLVPLLIILTVTSLIVGGCAQPAPAPTPAPAPAPSPAPAPAPAPTPSWPDLTFLTPPSGSNPNNTAVAWATLGKKYVPGLHISVEPKVVAPQAVIGFLKGNGDITYCTASISGPMFPDFLGGKKLAEGPHHLVACVGSAIHIVTTNPKINSVADLKGKKLLAKQVASKAVENTRPKILGAFGLTDDDVVLMAGDSAVHLAAQLREGVGEAAMLFIGLKDPSIVELCTTKDIKWISLPKEKMEEIAPSIGMQAGVIPAGTYPKQDEDVLAFTGLDSFDVRPSMSEDLAYELTKLFWEHQEEFASMVPWTASFILEEAPTRAYLPFHAGAVKYYKERGVWSEEAEALRQELLNKEVPAPKK